MILDVIVLSGWRASTWSLFQNVAKILCGSTSSLKIEYRTNVLTQHLNFNHILVNLTWLPAAFFVIAVPTKGANRTELSASFCWEDENNGGHINACTNHGSVQSYPIHWLHVGITNNNNIRSSTAVITILRRG